MNGADIRDAAHRHAEIIDLGLPPDRLLRRLARPDEGRALRVEHDRVRLAQARQIAGDPFPRRADERCIVDADEADLVEIAGGRAKDRQPLVKGDGPFDPGDAAHPAERLVGQRLDFVDIAHARVHHPDVGLADVEHLVRGARHQADEDRDLLAHQQRREGDAEDERKVFGAVADQHFERDPEHRGPFRRTVPPSLAGGEFRTSLRFTRLAGSTITI